jgi:[ribosomal protein S18]-alanine N-acetyltransferase
MSASGITKTAATSLAGIEFSPMESAHLDDVLAIERAIYPFPWTRVNFQDSLDSNYEAWLARDASQRTIGYFMLMLAVDEAHLLNLSVRADAQGKGIGKLLLERVCALARRNDMDSLLLEVRPSNARALSIYQHLGFSQIGVRKDYYPAAGNTRENAIVMRRSL